MSQPLVSKHLKVLRDVGLVAVRDAGRQRVYSVNGEPLKPIHDWVRAYEASWSRRFELMDEVLQDITDKERKDKED
jgi:DNA-binding transcriptional ArsR family regulator